MKKLTSSIALLALCVMIVFVSNVNSAGKQFGKITLPIGRVEVQSAGSEKWKKAGLNKAVFVNDKIRTRVKSRAVIVLTGGGEMRIGQNSMLELMKAEVMAMQKEFLAYLESGDVWVSAEAGFGVKNNVSVGTPTAVAAILGTKYRVKAGDDESEVLVYDGKVDVNAAKNIIDERQEKRKSLDPGSAPGKPKFKLGPVTEVSGPYEVRLEDWISLVEGMQINVRKDGKYHMFKFDEAQDADLDFVQWNKELDTAEK